MNKKNRYGITGLVVGGLGGALFNANKQLTAMQNNSQQEFNWQELLWNTIGCGLISGGIGYGIGVIADYENDQITPLNTDLLLLSFASKIKLNKNSWSYTQLEVKAEFIIEALKRRFSDKLKSSPMRMGSVEKGTALNENFDIDVCLPFRPGSFSSTRVMFDSVFSFLKTLIGCYSIREIRDQKKSIRIFLFVAGKEHKMDIVPYKISKSPGNKTAGFLYLNNQSLLGQSSYTKTDVHALNKQKLTPVQQELVVLLKYWKQKKNLPCSSHLLQNLVLDAYKYNKGKIPKKLTDKLVFVLKHIAENLDVAVIRSVENSNNIITKIPHSDKEIIIDACKKVVEDYQYQPNSIMQLFRA